ncbi:MAG TPA: S8 family serine peptidase [Solirubrobacterales bacterium]|nr:S8 family serine peptidase [Solirubrobacterales bacterium]
MFLDFPATRVPQAVAGAAVLLALLPAAACAQLAGSKGGGPLSPPLEVLARPAVAAEPLAAQARDLGLPARGPGSLLREGGRVIVALRLSRATGAALPDLRAAGADVLGADPRTRTATVSVPPSRLPDLAAVPGVRAVWQLRAPVVRTPEDQCEGGAAISEGLAQLQFDDARTAFELRGRGQTVGVLSDSYDVAGGAATGALDDVLSGDLPGRAGTCSDQQLPVDVLAEGPAGGGDEGRAMLQIVHDLAPHAGLAFATAFESEESFAENIERLARPVAEGGAGAGVIVDDVAWFEEPFFQDGPIAVAIENVVADGVNYLSAAGNDNLFDGSDEIASWEAPAFRDSGGCPEAIEKLAGFKGTHCMDFDPGLATDRTFGITVEAGELLTVDLQWAEPWFGVGSDLDAFLLSETGKLLTGSFEENAGASGTQRPVEIVQWENTSAVAKTVRLAVNRFSGAAPRLKFILLQNGGGVTATEYEQSSGGDVVGPAIYGHAGAADAIAVAAAPFNNSAKIERYSSRGPVTHYFGPVEGSAPAAALGSPEVLAKPDLAATDCGATTFFASLSAGVWRFCGTSAAAPHAAAAAVLVRQAKPTLPEQQVRSALTDTAAPVGAFGANAAGAGLLDAFAAIDGLPGPIEGGDGPSGQVPALEVPPGPAAVRAVIPPEDQPASPDTRILKHPPALVRTAAGSVRLVFRFGSDQAGATFLCKVDRRAFRACPSRFAHRYGLGRHVVKAKAQGATGLLDPTPVVFRFRVAPRA